MMYYKISHGSVTLGNNAVLEDINFCVKDNEKIGIVGRNGSGKTTLLKAIASEYEINSGYEEVIGQVSAQENGEDITIRDVGWYMDPAYQGKGYATEAAKAMIDYMFSEVEINGISSGAVKDNIGSCRMFEKLGFEKNGEVVEESPYTFYDGILTFSKYELTREDYFNNENNRV